MSLAVVRSRGLVGMSAPEVSVEVHLGMGLPAFNVVGLPEAEVRESRERVRAALLHNGFEFPNRRLTVNLAPADLPKESGRFDLPIALGILAASGQIDAAALERAEFVGELSLTGAIRPIRGALALAAAVSRDGADTRLVLPAANRAEAALVNGLSVLPAAELAALVAILRGEGAACEPDDNTARGHAFEDACSSGTRVSLGDASHDRIIPGFASIDPDDHPDENDLSAVKGHGIAKRALEIAAAGAHNLLMIGPPGAGKSMLASRLPSILPPMDDGEALEAAAIASLVGRFEPRRWRRRPFRAPHHSASMAALVGGGSNPRPGEASLAHHGTLFLDELPEFSRAALESLREPLETGRVLVSRAARSVELPARFQLVAAMNPCPCGYLGQSRCGCTPQQVQRYRARVSGPLLDRIDIYLPVRPVDERCLTAPRDGESGAVVAARVRAARQRQIERQGCCNAMLGVAGLDQHASLPHAALALLHEAAQRLHWSSRALHRVQRIARTVADLAGREAVDGDDVAEAISFRRALSPT